MRKIIFKWASYTVFGIFVALTLYLFLSPLVFNTQSKLRQRNFKDIDDANTYYSILSSSTGIIMGLGGLVLGVFFYHNRNKFDGENIKNERQYRRMEVFLQELNEYDRMVHKILSLNISNDNDLTNARCEMNHSYEIIESMLEDGLGLLGLDDKDLNAFIKLNSYVDQCEAISNKELKYLDKDKMYPIKDRYVELMKRARRVCYLKIK